MIGRVRFPPPSDQAGRPSKILIPVVRGSVVAVVRMTDSVARAFHIGATVKPEAVGSLFIFPLDAADDAFDLLTFTDAQTMLLQLGKTGIIAVFDDSCAALNRVMWIIEKIDGPVSRVQARDLTAHFAIASLDLLNRPRFWTRISADRGDVVIGGATDDVPIFRPYDQALFGSLMATAFPKLPEVTGLDVRRLEPD